MTVKPPSNYRVSNIGAGIVVLLLSVKYGFIIDGGIRTQVNKNNSGKSLGGSGVKL